MAHKTLIGGTAYEIKGGKTLVGGTAYSIKGGKTIVGGTVHEVGFGIPIGELAVGSSVFLNVNGELREFLVVHQGLPSSAYDSSCNGTWLLQKDIYENRKWHNSVSSVYSASDIHSYLNSTFIDQFDSNIKSAIKTVKIPYTNGSSGASGSVASGSSGLSAKAFLLSMIEVGFASSQSVPTRNEGAVLSYFSSADAGMRVAYCMGVANQWYLRSPSTDSTTNYVYWINSKGVYQKGNATKLYGVRPAIILPSDFEI